LGLPDPDNEKTTEKRAAVASANDEVRRVKAVSKKRGEYVSYNECIRVKMGRFASQYGTAAAVKKFSGELGSIKNAKLKCREFSNFKNAKLRCSEK